MSNQPQTIRDLIELKSDILKYPDQLTPEQASKELVELSSLFASVNKEILERKFWYNTKAQELLKEHGSAAKAKIYGEASLEWKSWMEAVGYKEAILEMLRSLKFFLRNAQEERKEARY